MQNVFSDVNQSEPDPIASLSGTAKCLGMNEIFLYFCQSMKMYIVVLYIYITCIFLSEVSVMQWLALIDVPHPHVLILTCINRN